MNTSSTSLLRTSITAAPRRRARRPMESVSASIAPYWMSSIASRSARRSTAASTSCRLTSMPGWSSTTICGLIKAAGASARPRCRLFLTHYHWRRRNSWLLDHCRQNTLPQTANTACQIKSELIHVKPNNISELVGKAGVARALEGAQPVRLQFVRLPDALHRTQRDADGFGHRPAGPVGGFVRRLGAGHRHHARRGFRRDRRLAGLAGLVAQQPVDPALGKALLPSPHRRPADADALRHLLRRVPICRGEDNLRPLDVFARPVSVGRDRRQLLALRSAQYHTYLLCHGPCPPSPWTNIAHPDGFVNLLNESEH